MKDEETGSNSLQAERQASNNVCLILMIITTCKLNPQKMKSHSHVNRSVIQGQLTGLLGVEGYSAVDKWQVI